MRCQRLETSEIRSSGPNGPRTLSGFARRPLSAERPALIYLCISTIEEPKAAAFARELVDHRLAACVNIIPGVRSIYRWQDKIHDEREAVLLIKAAPRTLGGFEERFVELHPYEKPELVLIPIEEGSKDYFYWVQKMTTGSVASPLRPHQDEANE